MSARTQKAPRGLAALYRVLLVGSAANDTAPAAGLEPAAEPVVWARFKHLGACTDPACGWCGEGEPHPEGR